MRFLKVAKALIHGDTSWTEGAPFQIFMASVIAVNSVVLGLELDIDWAGWIWFEHAFLIIYSFELVVRLKFFGCGFFINEDSAWNNLDLFMVCGGAVELWFMPAWSFLELELFGESAKNKRSLVSFVKILRTMRMVRVLRLVRLLRMVKPLYRLLLGIVHALAAMQWVLLLALLVLYAGAIIFTSLIGHGLIYASAADVPAEAEVFFGSVSSSFFSLFKLMNGDTTVVEAISHDPRGALLFACFMVLSNWAVLAILTSVISDNMISSSQRLVEEDKEREEEERLSSRKQYLTRLFQQIDTNISGAISKTEWNTMLADEDLKEELKSASGLDDQTLDDVFSCLSLGEEEDEIEERFMYEDFITYLNHDKDVADRRQLLHLSHLMKEMEKNQLNRVQTLEQNNANRFTILEGGLEKLMLAIKQVDHKEVSPLSDEMQKATFSRLGRLEDMLEKVVSTGHEKSRSHSPRVSNAVEKTTLSRIGELENATQRRFEVLEGMLEKVVLAVTENNHRQGPPALNDTEKTTLSRISNLEVVTEQKFNVLEGMLKKVTDAVSQKPREPLRL